MNEPDDRCRCGASQWPHYHLLPATDIVFFRDSGKDDAWRILARTDFDAARKQLLIELGLPE